jgi:S-adenosylmethionine hydrolase
MSIITLTTDFGTVDHYAASMKGVILSISPSVRVVDVTHQIEPQNVMQAAIVLFNIWGSFPKDTVHVVVVDPGVGSDRGIILSCYEGCYVLAPDNGVISMIHREHKLERAVVVDNERFFQTRISATFHGRDIFAPVAARLAGGAELSGFGSPAGDFELLSIPKAGHVGAGKVSGEVLYVDHFGNLITNISAGLVDEAMRQHPGLEAYVNGVQVGPIRRTFCEVSAGAPVAYVSSSQFLAIGVNLGSAKVTLDAGVGAKVELR